MAMKYLKLYQFVPPHATSVLRTFKWEYRVVWTYPKGVCLQVIHCPNRAEARRTKRSIDQRLKPKLQRRLVQTEWSDYRDSFSYSEKGNGNGR